MLLDLVENFPAGQVVDLDDLGGAADGHEGLVGGQVGRQDDVVFVAQGQDALAGLEVPTGDFSALPATASAGEDDLSVAAEHERFDEPIRVG